MKRLTILLTIFCLILSSVVYAGDKDIKDNNLTFMTFNIRVGGGIENPGMGPGKLKSSKEKMEKIASAIRSIDPDIVALQEVKGSRQAKQLSKMLNMTYAYKAHSDLWGLAILSKHKIKKTKSKKICKNCKLKLRKDRVVKDPRIGLVSVIDIKGKQITFVNVHYHVGVYEQQVKETMKVLDGISGPIVLMGDLNRQQHDSEIKPIQDKLSDTCLEVGREACENIKNTGTKISGRHEGLRIDYIFVDPESFEVKDVGIVEKYRDASDHYAYFTHVVGK